MGCVRELPNPKEPSLVLEDGRLALIVEVVRAREECDDGWEARPLSLSVHPITKIMTRVNMCEKSRQPRSHRTRWNEVGGL